MKASGKEFSRPRRTPIRMIASLFRRVVRKAPRFGRPRF
jgi:hypothetical protein